MAPTDPSANLTQPTLGIPSGPLDVGQTIICRRPAPIPSVNLRTADCTNIIGRLNARGDFIIHPTDNIKNFLMEGDIKRAGCRIKIAPDQHYHARHVDLSLNQHKVYILYTTVMNKPCKEGGDMINFYDTARRINIAGWVFSVYHPYWDNN